MNGTIFFARNDCDRAGVVFVNQTGFAGNRNGPLRPRKKRAVGTILVMPIRRR